MKVTEEEALYIAKLAKLKLSGEELAGITKDLNEILEYVSKLNEIDTANVEPLSHPVENHSLMREDTIKASVAREDALKNAPSRNEEYFTVPKVIQS